MSVKNNILKNASAGIFSKVSISFIRLLQVPLLIHFLGVEDFGRWTVLFTIPSWLAFTNLGFGSVGANQMSMFVANGEIQNARKVFSTTLAVIALITIVGSVFSILIAPFVKWEIFLKTNALRHSELVLCVIWMCLTVFISFLYEAFGGIYRAAHKAHLGVLLASILPWFNLLAMFISLNYSTRFDYIALSLLLSNVLFLGVYFALSLKVMPELSFSFKLVQPSDFKYLFRKGFAFQAFPLGNALVIQGNIIIIQVLLGPVAVALFGTAKTLVNTIKQVLDIISQATWPELSHLIGSNDLKKAAQIHQTGVALSVVLSVLGVLFLTFFGETIYSLWVGKSILLPFHLLILFLLPIPFNALWITSSVVHMASNKHEGLAIRYIIAALISSVACLILTYMIGIEGAAFSIVIMDIILIPYVIRYSLILTNDTWGEFLPATINLIIESPRLIILRIINLTKKK
jgi:O-antigen/teichoic acid export membrane protein